MLKKLILATTSVIALSAAPAAIAAESGAFMDKIDQGDWLSSDVIGMSVYGGVAEDAERIGDVNNLIVTPEGEVEAVIIGVGGFLGVAEKNVAVKFSELAVVEVKGEERLVLDHGKESLDKAPELKTEEGEDYRAALQETADQARKAMTGEVDQTKLVEVDPTELKASDLVGARVYTPESEWIGEVGDVIFTDDNGIEAVVIDFGGFLGVGEKPVAVEMSELTFKSDEPQSGEFFVYTNMSKQQLEAAPEYQAASTTLEQQNRVIEN